MKLKFRFASYEGTRGLHAKSGRYGFTIAETSEGYFVHYAINSLPPVNKLEGSPFKTLEEAGNAAQEKFESLLKSN